MGQRVSNPSNGALMTMGRTRLFITFLVVTTSFAMIWAQPENPMRPDWSRYHSTEATHRLLSAWAQSFPELTELYSIGQTLRGTPLQVLEITNKQTGPAADKTRLLLRWKIFHAGELTGAEVALHFAWYLLSNYERDARIRELLETRTLYVRPKFNPDGADLALNPPYPALRSTPRPYDQDLDGLLDEDPGNDLNGDGVVTQMRVPDPNGQWKVSRSTQD